MVREEQVSLIWSNQGREKELGLKTAHKSSDQSKMARNGQKIKLRNRATSKNIADEGHHGFLSW